MTADFKQGTNLAGKVLASDQLTTGAVLSFTGGPTGGTFTVAVTTSAGAVTTANQTYAAGYTAATLQTALQGLSNVGSGKATVSGSNGGPFTITLDPTIAGTVSVGASALTGGTTPLAVMTGADTTIYTVPASTATKIATCVLCNTATFAVTVYVSVVPSGQSLATKRRVVSAYVLNGSDSTKITELEGAMLDAGAFVVVNASTALNAVNFLMTGAESS